MSLDIELWRRAWRAFQKIVLFIALSFGHRAVDWVLLSNLKRWPAVEHLMSVLTLVAFMIVYVAILIDFVTVFVRLPVEFPKITMGEPKIMPEEGNSAKGGEQT